MDDVERQIKILNAKVEKPFSVENIERYWKDKTIFECSLKTSVQGPTKEEYVYNTIVKAHSISKVWEINGPFQNGENNLIFEGVFNEEVEGKPLKWAHFMLELKGL